MQYRASCILQIIIHCSIFSHSHWLRAYDEFFVFCWWREHMTNNYRICHVLTPSELFGGPIQGVVSYRDQCAHNLYMKLHTELGRLWFDLRLVVCFNFYLHADFSCKMNNKRIIEFGFRRISELFRPRSALSASASLRQITLTSV